MFEKMNKAIFHFGALNLIHWRSNHVELLDWWLEILLQKSQRWRVVIVDLGIIYIKAKRAGADIQGNRVQNRNIIAKYYRESAKKEAIGLGSKAVWSLREEAELVNIPLFKEF